VRPGPPGRLPLGLRLTRSSKIIERAFNDAMTAAGGSAPMWSILIACKSHGGWNQNELAASIGIRGATLTHHLDAMEEQGLLTRRRDPANRRVHIVELTAAGERMFMTLREVAISFDRQLRKGIPAADREIFEAVLDSMVDNVRSSRPAVTPAR
jgi:MarR family transcriptional regulator for hemolysin